MCLASRKDVARSKEHWGKLKRPKALYISVWKSKFATTGALQWWCAILYYLGTLAICLFTFFWGYAQIRGVIDSSIIFSLGLGAVSGKTFVNFSNPHYLTQQESVEASSSSATLLRNVVIANAPQIFASMIYFTYNSLVTSLSLAAEWGRFAVKRKAPRIAGTVPVGQQRGSYFLQLPFRYSIPLIVTSGVLHWLLSQTLFVVLIEVYRQWLELDPRTGEPYVAPAVRVFDVSKLGWSPIGAVIVMVLGAAMVVVLIGAACWPLRSNMPVAGSCSAAISAACHPPEPRDPDAWMKPLMWGETAVLIYGSFKTMTKGARALKQLQQQEQPQQQLKSRKRL
ncbi:hypothetical protein VTJ04DRAFT_4344 [Mycothermus thermophilus]|uniref:uncharacterized protein n=1 Tax=Humicola insolens TaxID=85995 RepID=UPI003743ECF4